jgi:hypothetical protein
MNVVTFGRELRWSKASIERGHRPVAGLGQFGKQIAVRIRRVREPVQAQR